MKKTREDLVEDLREYAAMEKHSIFLSEIMREAADLIEKETKAFDVLSEIVETPCEYDRKDYCQNHYHMRPCPHETGQRLLSDLEAR